MSKQFTAIAILQLVEQGRLTLDDLLCRHYPGAPPAWDKITIRHLLTHTSGIPSCTAIPGFFKTLAKLDRTPREIVALTAGEPLSFEPGTQFEYSNSGFSILGCLVENVSGLTFADYIEKNILTPLGMCDTGQEDNERIIERRAAGYKYVDGCWSNAAYIAMSVPFAAGSYYSTIDDLLRWERALHRAEPVGAETLRAMFKDHGHSYGFAWAIYRQFGRLLWSHCGGINGFSSVISHYPDEELTIVLLANLQAAPVQKMASELAALHFGLAGSQIAVSLDPPLLNDYVGFYQLGPGLVLTVSQEGARLFARATGQPKLELFAKNDHTFFYKVTDAEITFEADGVEPASRLHFHRDNMDRVGRRIDETTARRIEAQWPKRHKAINMDRSTSDAHVGRYRLASKSVLTFSRDGNRYFMHRPGQPRIEFFPETEKDYFAKEIDAQICFEIESDGHARRLLLIEEGLDTPGELMEKG
jgi:CubicO group peptidase (beta-lactamase class C family)